MKNKLLVLFGGFLLWSLLGLFSCGDHCGPFPNKFKTVGLDWFIFKATYSETAERKLVLSEIENDSIDYKHYSICISPKIETYFVQTTDRCNFNLIQTAYACSPAIPTTDEIMDSIVIVSETDFDLTHPSGTDLSDVFDIVVLDDANGIYYDKYNLNDYLATNPNVPGTLTLILREQPDMTSDFVFLVKYYQNGIDTNDYFEFTTNGIVIKRDE